MSNTRRKSLRLQPVRQLKHQAERQQAKLLAEAQQQLQIAQQQINELKTYYSEYLSSLSTHNENFRQAKELQVFHAFFVRLQQAIDKQQEVVRQREQAVMSRMDQWRQASASLKSIDELIATARRQEMIEQDKKEQKIQDDRNQNKRFPNF